MATNQPYRNVAYGLSEPLLNVFPAPIISVRDPLTTDKAQLGTVWVNKSTDDAWVLTSIVANVASWVGIGGGTGTFAALTVNPGNITATAGNISATAGSLSAGTTVTAGTGIASTTGNIVATAGAVNAGTTMTAGTGITATTGNIVATAGAVNAGTTMTAGTGITATTGNISALSGGVSASGVVSGLMLSAIGDSGSGFATITTITNATNTTQGVGVLGILSTTGNPGNNAGFIKVYVGLTPAYIPYYTNIAP